MIIDIFKNPVIIGLIMGTLTYLYIMWTNKKKFKKDPESKKTYGIITPIIVGVITWVIAYNYFNTGISENIQTIPITNTNIDTGFDTGLALSKQPSNNQDNVLSSSSDMTKSYHLIGKGINVPHQLPDVFIETI